MDNQKFIEKNFCLSISDMSLLDCHFGTEIFIASTKYGRLIVKKVPCCMKGVENEGHITSFLCGKGIKVPRFFQTTNGEYAAHTENHQFTVQEFIDGQTFSVNSAPDWLLDQSAEILGNINCTLCEYGELPLNFGGNFFNPDAAIGKWKYYEAELLKAKDDTELASKWEEQILHLKKIAGFDFIDASKLTYANSHGDFNICQLVVSGREVAVIDWASACNLPVCLEVMTSFVFASKKCANGAIDETGLKRYIGQYTKYFPLSDYDLRAMPYVFYFWHCVCNYTPTEQIPKSYQKIAKLISDCLNWLYSNVDDLSLA